MGVELVDQRNDLTDEQLLRHRACKSSDVHKSIEKAGSVRSKKIHKVMLLAKAMGTLALLDVTGAKTVRGAVGAQITLRPETYRGKLTIAIEALPVQPESD